jgi:hypothetical protein
LPDGATLDYPRDDPSPFLLQSSWHQIEDGRFAYDLDIDVSDVSRIDIGDRAHSVGSGAVFSQPNGWLSSARGWMHYDTAHESTDVSASSIQADIRRFSISSSMLPGPMPIQLIRKDANIPTFGRPIRDIPFTLSRRLYDAVRKTLEEQVTFLNNNFIIGPAITPNSTQDNVRQLVQTWFDSYGFDFLKPVLQEDRTLSANLDQLEPATDFERAIVECLRRVALA